MESFFIKVTVYAAATLLKRAPSQCFPGSFPKFSKELFCRTTMDSCFWCNNIIDVVLASNLLTLINTSFSYFYCYAKHICLCWYMRGPVMNVVTLSLKIPLTRLFRSNIVTDTLWEILKVHLKLSYLAAEIQDCVISHLHENPTP